MKRLILAVFALTLFCQTNLLASEEVKSFPFPMNSSMIKGQITVTITEHTTYESLFDQAKEYFKRDPKRIIAQGGDFLEPEIIDSNNWNSIKNKMLNDSRKADIKFVVVF